ncbi:MAG: DNA topoisomerase 4 subunit A [Deltaproteobacteria bacterium]|nr:MAG: DNA topoisomerase 4 subunit A [Deltaproteobacteria bacterium]
MSINIKTVEITEELKNSFKDYAVSVILGRALPDVRDGLKPVHRRILYAMYSEGLLANKKFSKSAGVVGEVLKKYHPHGDSSVYDALVRLSQDWNMREPLIEGQGNFGSIDGDPAAAYRYTECRLTKIAEEFLLDIDKKTVSFFPNFDGTVEEPQILPAKIPNFIINGSEGIAVAMVSKCPPHNLGEVISALLEIIEEKYFNGPMVDIGRLEELIPGPDYPTGGYIYGDLSYKDILETGRGSVTLRGKSIIGFNEEIKRKQIIIEEIPYQVNKSKLIEKIVELVKGKNIDGILEVRDESSRDGLRIAIDLKREAIEDIVLQRLYDLTPLQSTYAINILGLVDGSPKIIGMREFLEVFLRFRYDIIRKRSQYELSEKERRFRVIVAFLVALKFIDRVIDIIRLKKTVKEAKLSLCEEIFTFKEGENDPIIQMLCIQNCFEKGRQIILDEFQAESILDMKLSKLVHLEKRDLEDEALKLSQEILTLKSLLEDVQCIMQVIKEECLDIRLKYSSARKTVLCKDSRKGFYEDKIPEEDMLISVSYFGYIKRTPFINYLVGDRKIYNKKLNLSNKEDFTQENFLTLSNAYLLIFTNLGRIYWIKVHEIPIASANSVGVNIANFIKLKEEKVAAIVTVRRFSLLSGEAFILISSKHGQIKKMDLICYSNPKVEGMSVWTLQAGDEVIGAQIIGEECDILLSTKFGMAIRFDSSEVKNMSKNSKGVKGIHLKDEDEVVSIETVEKDCTILIVTEFGFGGKVSENIYKKQLRGGVGMETIKITEKNGCILDALKVKDCENAVLTTDNGSLFRIRVCDVLGIKLRTKCLRIAKLHKKVFERIVSISKIVA